MEKKAARTRRARRSRSKIRSLGIGRLCVHRTPRHIYAQLISEDGTSVIAAASTLEKDIRSSLRYTGNAEAATAVGTAIASRAREKGLQKVAFDRSGFRFHGRVKALADAAREGGLEF
ncbi:MAG: 50S ribosomal protein L18 [Gammaproteobacteria bacterium]|nr:50S ribosomal protein L18 [Gammaproteobacteria bacterium]